MTLERIEHKVFASEAPLDEMGQFGSALATTKLNTKDVAEIQALPAYTKGWGSAIISENNYPAMEEMNGVLNVMSYHTGYLYQEGIPTYSATPEYSVTSWVKDLAGEKIYKSLQGGNKGHDLTDPAWWEELKLGGGGLEIGDVGFTQMAIDETKGKRRILNGQLIIQEQYVKFANIVKNSIALNSDLACTEVEWQTELTMSANGVCYKFVIDDEAGTIRLPKYPDYLDLSINGAKSVSVYGNGKTLGLIWGDGSGVHTAGMSWSITNTHPTLEKNNALYNATVGSQTTNINTGSSSVARPVGVTKDSTASGLVGSVTTSSEQIKGQYFIQVATGAETEDNIINEIELNNPFSLLDYKFSEYELNNLSWLRSEGQYNSNAIYPAVYELLLKIYNGTETKAGVSVKLTTETFTDYDFVLNTAEETFRLPLKVKLASGKAVVGNGMALGLLTKNGSGGWADSETNERSPQIKLDTYGAIINSQVTSTTDVGANGFIGITTDPNNSGIETSDNGLYLYFYVGETVQNANLINAGRIEEKVASLIPNNSGLITNYLMPDYSTQVSTSTSGYVCPYNCFIVARSTHANRNANDSLSINGVYVAIIRDQVYGTSYSADLTVPLFASKGDVITWTDSATIFVYKLKGDL